MNEQQRQEEQEAWFSRADRFDGFDRGDLDNPHADDYGDQDERVTEKCNVGAPSVSDTALIPAACPAAPGPLAATYLLQATMARAGWEIDYIDLDLTGSQPKADIRIKRDDGRWLLARVDAHGRATVERFQRCRELKMPADTKGRQPLVPTIEDTFLGREKHAGARAMLRNLTAYLADNALRPVALADMRSSWAAVMAMPLRLEHAAIAKATGGAA